HIPSYLVVCSLSLHDALPILFERIFTHIVWQAMEKGLVGGQYLFTDSTHLKASANKNKKHNEKREVRVSHYIAMLNEDVAKVREAKGKKTIKASEKEVEDKDNNESKNDTERTKQHR